MSNEQVFIACVLSFLAGCLLIHYLGPAGKRARRLHKALSRLSLVHDTYYTESQEALGDLDKERARLHNEYSRQVMAFDQVNAIRGKQERSIELLKMQNKLLNELTDSNRGMAVLIVQYIDDCQKIASKSLAVPHKVDYSLIKIKELADLIVGPAANKQ
jgi:hypothetical protein